MPEYFVWALSSGRRRRSHELVRNQIENSKGISTHNRSAFCARRTLVTCAFAFLLVHIQYISHKQACANIWIWMVGESSKSGVVFSCECLWAC